MHQFIGKYFTSQNTLDKSGSRTYIPSPAVWTALEAEGLGANLQHFNFHPGISAEILSTFDLPGAWKLKAQLVFGKPTAGPQADKKFEPIEKRVLVKA